MANVNRMRAVSVAVFLGGMVSSLVMAAPAEVDKVTRQEISERIAPVGELCVEGQPCATAAPVAKASGGSKSASEIYDTYCTACHTAGVLGAPKKGDADAWNKKLAAAGSFDKLLASAIKGVGAMPPNGTCPDCTPDDISAAIEYMSGLKP